MSTTSDTVRRLFKEGDDIRDAGLTTPDDIVRIDNIHYAEEDPCQVLDVYRPRDAEGERIPVLVSVHGGGWVYGDKDRYQWYCMSLAQHGFAVVNFTYRLAPEHKFPAGMQDTNLVFDWVLRHSNEFGFDADHVFAVGDSAGAHMLAMYAAACTDATYAAELSICPPEGFVPAGVALNCGTYRISAAKKTGDSMLDMLASLMEDLLPGGGTAEEFRLLSPIERIGADFPPAFVMTAEGDFLRTEALPLVHKLDDLGIEVCYHYYKSPERELGHVFHCNMRLAEAKQCNADECAFFWAHV